MSTDYEKVYQEQRHALGQPTKEYVTFFNTLEQPLRVLDLGCGQGRDALFISRLGHHVTGVDLSESGITQLLEDAHAEGLKVKGIVSDLTGFHPDGIFDVVVIDRTLHMLAPENQLLVLERTKPHVAQGGYVLICDERKNLPAMKKLFQEDRDKWQVIKEIKGFLFLQKNA